MNRRSNPLYILAAIMFVVITTFSLTLTRTASSNARTTPYSNSGAAASRGRRQPNIPAAVREAIEKARYKITLEERAAGSSAYQPSNQTQETHLFASDGADSDDFGISVAISGDTIVVGKI